MSQVADLLAGVGSDLTSAGIGIYDEARVWTDADTQSAITMVRMPAEPDRAIALTAYYLDAGPDEAIAQLRLQIRCRGSRNAPLDPGDIDEQVSALLRRLTDRAYGSVTVNQFVYYSSIPLGPDDADRWEQSTNWTVDTSDPSRE